MAKAKRKRHLVVDAVASLQQSPPPSPLAAAAGPSARRSKKCPLCRKRTADTQVTIGVVNMEVCSRCSEPVWSGLNFFAALTRFL